MCKTKFIDLQKISISCNYLQISVPFSLPFILCIISPLLSSFYRSPFLPHSSSLCFSPSLFILFQSLTLYFFFFTLFPPSLFLFSLCPTFPKKNPFLLFQLCRRWNPFNNSDCNQTGEGPTKHSAKPWYKFIHKLQTSFIICTLQTWS
jgi:hypothetical protein